MDDLAYRAFFERPTHTYHRRYEALRSVFVDQRPQNEVAQEFGFTYDSMRQLVREFRRSFDTKGDSIESPFFGRSMPDVHLLNINSLLILLWPIVGNLFSLRRRH